MNTPPDVPDEPKIGMDSAEQSPLDKLLEESDIHARTVPRPETAPNLAEIDGLSEILTLFDEAEAVSAEKRLLGDDIIINPERYLEASVRGHYWKAITKNVETKGQILLLPGFTEFCEKYASLADLLVSAGYDVLMLDWPGQGRSGHLGFDPLIVHSDNFESHRYAVMRLLQETEMDRAPFHVIGHSMGGYFALHVAQRYARNVKKLVLCSPMFVPKAPPLWLVKLLTTVLVGLGRARYHPPFRSYPDFEHIKRFRLNNPLTRDLENYERPFRLYDHVPSLFRTSPSVGWIKTAFEECEKYSLNAAWLREISASTLLCLPGDERVVDSAATMSMVAHLRQCRTIHFHEARHELFAELPEVRRRLMANILTFLEEDDDVMRQPAAVSQPMDDMGDGHLDEY